MSDPSLGGNEWEAQEGLKLMLLGLTRFSEALRNIVASQLAKQQIPVLKEQLQAREDRKEEQAAAEHNMGMLLDQAELEQAEQGRQSARLGVLEVEQADLQTLLRLARGIPDLIRRVEALEARERT